ncbi:META domain-containing protein [Pseudomonas sp. OIL-1]|uniref:META domain-containing protein n=1 Tax=Pseudomonas sp. OIL-1 TaxID=2706126 RepID=UPI0013A718B2|nr:META domain-containing protein [Pseudomonas sp. OIL-1]QIB50624.1 META domain-containing protein [Pseudomonas sp. OIL-1]
MRYLLSAMLMSVSLSMLTGCSDDSPAPAQTPPVDASPAGDEQTQMLRITGDLTYQARTALQPESQAVIELRYAAPGETEPESVLARQRIDLIGRNVPVHFVLEVDPEQLQRADAYQLRAMIMEGERATWLAEPVEIGPTAEEINLGELVLLPHREAAFSSILSCGQAQISVGYEGDDLILEVADDEYILLPVETHAGARFEAEGDPATRFWSRGNSALLTLQGKAYPECVPPGALPKPFLASGNEPAWHVRLENGELTWQRPDQDQEFTAPYQIIDDNSEGVTIEAGQEGSDHGLRLTAHRSICYDSMTAMPYPREVSLTVDGEALQGCGGDPARLLQGAEWVVEDINGGGIIDGSRVELAFLHNDRLAGQASCNNYSAEYELTTEALVVGDVISTKKACPPALMEQEHRFLDMLQRVQQFRFNEQDALVLLTAEGESLTARMR